MEYCDIWEIPNGQSIDVSTGVFVARDKSIAQACKQVDSHANLLCRVHPSSDAAIPFDFSAASSCCWRTARMPRSAGVSVEHWQPLSAVAKRFLLCGHVADHHYLAAAQFNGVDEMLPCPSCGNRDSTRQFRERVYVPSSDLEIIGTNRTRVTQFVSADAELVRLLFPVSCQCCP